MAGLVKVIVVGNLGREPETRYTQDGKPVLRFSVAASTRRKNREGEWEDHAEWFSVTVFGRQAENLAERLSKGSRVYVDGRLESREYESNGKRGFSLDVIANDVLMLDPRVRDESAEGAENGSTASPQGTAPTPIQQPRPRPAARARTAEDEDLPF